MPNTCHHVIAHWATPGERQQITDAIDHAVQTGDTAALPLLLARLMEPCAARDTHTEQPAEEPRMPAATYSIRIRETVEYDIDLTAEQVAEIIGDTFHHDPDLITAYLDATRDVTGVTEREVHSIDIHRQPEKGGTS
ncbi:hypothetical protein ACFWPV_09975 [Streptomyces uncialis]|uniref:hypothetical protein n=1 Tax=Streptomyces uncialis TaxID=1048205 RepID=UPI00365CB4B9